ncbi:basic proline-rich protein-like [Panthera uncia]|uniref:basic proline-rich protein-like n=1 Tax=Panthera uncia TaxID=29064 RepID=UPI0020FFEFA6|nr:basic proline-rich protein-like [Panthera uncia]
MRLAPEPWRHSRSWGNRAGCHSCEYGLCRQLSRPERGRYQQSEEKVQGVLHSAKKGKGRKRWSRLRKKEPSEALSPRPALRHCSHRPIKYFAQLRAEPWWFMRYFCGAIKRCPFVKAQGFARDKLPRPPRSPPLGPAAPPSRAPLPEPRPAAARGWARGAPGPRRPAETSSRPAAAPGRTPPAPAPSPPGARSTPSGASSPAAPGPRAPGDRAPVAGAAVGPAGTGEPRAAATRAAAAPSSRGAHAEVPARRPKWDIRYIVGIPRASRDPASRVTLGRIPARAGRLRPWLLGGRPAPLRPAAASCLPVAAAPARRHLPAASPPALADLSAPLSPAPGSSTAPSTALV